MEFLEYDERRGDLSDLSVSQRICCGKSRPTQLELNAGMEMSRG